MSQVLPLGEPERTEATVSVFSHTLTRLGFTARRADGTVWPVRFDEAFYYPAGDAAFIGVDVHRLPRKVTTLALAAPTVLHELSMAIGGLPVTNNNTSGLVYVVRYTPPIWAARQLPRRVDLELAGRPAALPFAVPLGVDAHGRAHWVSLLRLLNVLIGGEPGAGKSMLLNCWLAALTQAHGPAELQLTLVDPKRVELYGWRAAPGTNYAETPAQAEALLDELRDDIERRGRLFQAVGARTLMGYNQVAAGQRWEVAPLPLRLVVIDELTDLTLQAGGSRGSLFRKLISAAAVGRALGVLFLIATQSPRAEIIDGNLKATLNTRIAFRTASRADSRVIMDRSEAADLPSDAPGRLLVTQAGRLRAYQGYYLADVALRALQNADAALRAGGGLTPDEQRVLALAVQELDGAFPIKELYTRLGPKSAGGISQRWLEGLAQCWEARGWLVADPSDPTRPRQVAATVAAHLLAGAPAAA